MNIFEELKARGLVFQTTDEEALVKALTEGQVSYYTGYDPTADSLHLGHLVAILTSRRLQLAGHKPYALVGGATGLIGDPSFKDAERSLQTKDTVDGWVTKIQGQLSRFLDFENGDNKAEMVNNYDWFSDISFIDFLRDVGKYYTVNYMMSKDSVKKRIETGISYTEFAYQIMQGYDFYELNDKYNVTLQIGGSDQWGNMTAGTELLRRKADKSGHVMTVPLITDSTGKKFGKSEGNAVWLDADKTSPYEMYQFWLNVMDDDAVRFLKIFTFLSLDEIAEIEKQFDAARHERLAQKILAREVVTLVHGEEAYKQALNITEQLFAGNIKNLSAKELKQGLSNVPNYAVQAEDNLNIVELLVTSGIVNSKRQAREDVQNGAIYVNGERVQDLDYTLSDSDKIDGELTVIRRGKKKYSVLKFEQR
ncbi:TPA: tyrosine--tRNA ligase [Streptococcus suis]|nr:tyrosine--tRNA ligase [Streptococcus suis]